MLINGTSYKILPDHAPEQRLGLKWAPLANGAWYAVDRGSAADYYASTINFYGLEAAINALIATIETNRTSGSNILSLSGFNEAEAIFGMGIDYTGTINATVDTVGPPRRTQGSWRGWGLQMRLVALSPATTAISPALPPLRLIAVGVDADSDRTISKNFSYFNSLGVADHASDYGTFTGTFTFADVEMARLRLYLAQQRGATITIPKLYGIQYPFGPRSPHTANPTNFPAKIISLADEKIYGVGRWTCTLQIAESF